MQDARNSVFGYAKVGMSVQRNLNLKKELPVFAQVLLEFQRLHASLEFRAVHDIFSQ